MAENDEVGLSRQLSIKAWTLEPELRGNVLTCQQSEILLDADWAGSFLHA